jgi:hypothetical protein
VCGRLLFLAFVIGDDEKKYFNVYVEKQAIVIVFHLFRLPSAIVLSALRFTTCDHPLDIFNHFLHDLYMQQFMFSL